MEGPRRQGFDSAIAVLWARVGNVEKTIDALRTMRDALKKSFQLLLYDEPDFGVRPVRLLSRTRMAFKSSIAISISAALILFFNMSATV